MSMFTNYDNMPSSYTPDNISPARPPEGCYMTTVPYLVYNANGKVIGYQWSYGDTVVLNFKVSGRVLYDAFGYVPYNESISTYMSTGNQYFNFKIYNNRFDSIYTAQPDFKCEEDGTVSVKVIIYDTLAQKLVKGQYYLSLGIEGTQINPLHAEDPTQPETLKIRQTIMKPEDCPVWII